MHTKRLVIVCMLGLAAAGAHAALYKWVDEQGRVQYSDTPPQKTKGGVQMTSRGVVIKKLDADLTPEQQKVKDQEEARKKAEEARATEQRRQDSALLQSYTGVKEIDMKRDREIQLLEAALANLRGQERGATERLTEDRRRLSGHEKSKKPAPDSLKEDILRGEAEKKAIDEEVRRKLDEIAATRIKYEAQKKRYLELKQNPLLVQPASTAAASPPKK